MKAFLVQVNETKPNGWKTVQGKDRRDAAVRAAAAAGLGRHTVYVALEQSRHANGAPLTVQAYIADVGKDGDA